MNKKNKENASKLAKNTLNLKKCSLDKTFWTSLPQKNIGKQKNHFWVQHTFLINLGHSMRVLAHSLPHIGSRASLMVPRPSLFWDPCFFPSYFIKKVFTSLMQAVFPFNFGRNHISNIKFQQNLIFFLLELILHSSYFQSQKKLIDGTHTNSEQELLTKHECETPP